MENYITNILNNSLVTGIGGSTVSGFIVYFVTSKLLSKKQNKEYSQKVTTANNELLYIMRPLIVQKQIPSKSIIESVIESTARKYEVNGEDLFDTSLLVDDLIREVMENAFLDSEQKMEFCNKINELKIKEEAVGESIHVFEKVLFRKDFISSQYVSILLAITASSMVLFFSFYIGLRGGMPFDSLDNFSEISVITSAVAVVPITIMLMTLILKRIRRHERDNKKDENNKNKK